MRLKVVEFQGIDFDEKVSVEKDEPDEDVISSVGIAGPVVVTC